ncbi:MAG: bifunctional UDP-N-acetylglucosamine diphosphorylase/glucosamine-1-phosphate N-acetyltransferase GlmU [Actinomycetota bacterium]|nr:bifunctional UDP-N-acetylglucosamine diphosphorylase/glucosamine-1-phosphate N-acetyltransferase GlmU [Actinomycetota bacterium]
MNVHSIQDARLAETTTTPRTLAAVVLAAGKGKRLRSSTPKVLHPVCGRPLLWHVLQTLRVARPTKIVIVVGHGADDVREAVASWGITPAPVFVEQTEQLGTGHAVLEAERVVGRAAEVLVANGDFDPVRPDDVRALLRTHRRTKSAASVLTAEMDEPGGYGRVIRDGNRLVAIREPADASRAELQIREGATNWIVFRRADLYRALPLVGRENHQREYYLKDVYEILLDKGERVSAVRGDTGGTIGANSRAGLASLEAVLRARINAAHMDAGVTLLDPATTYIDAGVKIGSDTVVFPLTFLEGGTVIGKGCRIGPSTRLVDTRIADAAEVTFSVAEGARVGRGADVGPFARLRPGTVLAAGVHVGSYVEIKESTIGRDTKVPHLSYIGDANVGSRTNIGAATVTANYDGYRKHRTVIGDDVRIGSDTMLVAPVKVGKGAVTGAGSVITKDVPAGSLAVERSEQRTVKGYRRRRDAEHRGS